MAFLEEVRRGLTSTGKQVAKKTKEITGTVQLKAQIAAEKETAEKSLAAIGRQVFETASQAEEERFKAEFASVRKSEARIRELEAQLSELDGSIFCSECGARIDKSSVFCSHCGTRVEREPAELSAIAAEDGEAEKEQPGEAKEEDQESPKAPEERTVTVTEE